MKVQPPEGHSKGVSFYVLVVVFDFEKETDPCLPYRVLRLQKASENFFRRFLGELLTRPNNKRQQVHSWFWQRLLWQKKSQELATNLGFDEQQARWAKRLLHIYYIHTTQSRKRNTRRTLWVLRAVLSTTWGQSRTMTALKRLGRRRLPIANKMAAPGNDDQASKLELYPSISAKTESSNVVLFIQVHTTVGLHWSRSY